MKKTKTKSVVKEENNESKPAAIINTYGKSIEQRKRCRLYSYKQMHADLKTAAIAAIYNNMSHHTNMYNASDFNDSALNIHHDTDRNICNAAAELIKIIRDAELTTPKIE